MPQKTILFFSLGHHLVIKLLQKEAFIFFSKFILRILKVACYTVFSNDELNTALSWLADSVIITVILAVAYNCYAVYPSLIRAFSPVFKIDSSFFCYYACIFLCYFKCLRVAYFF